MAYRPRGVGEVSILHLNKYLLTDHGDGGFSDDQVYERSGVLADRVIAVWPAGPAPAAASETVGEWATRYPV